MNATWAAIVGAIGLVVIPVVAWFAIPALNRTLGPFGDSPMPRTPGRWYGWQLRMRAIVGLPVALFMLWIIALFAVLQAFVRF